MENQITFDPKKLDVVDIDTIRPNPWNPKKKDTAEYKNIVESIRLKGQRLPVIVRENEGFEIIDGEQKWRACKELGFERVIVYNEGKLDDREAKELTIWYQQQVPFDELSLAKLVVELSTSFDDIQLPFAKEKIEEMRELVKFDWEKYKLEKTPDTDTEGMTLQTFAVDVTKDQYEIVQTAMAKVKEEKPDMSDGRALELICADYLAGASVKEVEE